MLSRQLAVCVCAVASALSLTSMPARPDGVMLPSIRSWNARRERALINEPDQKALIVFSQGQEQLIISPSYQGDIHEFAWVVPVPDRPRVEILTGAPFHELARLVAPTPPRRFKSRAGKMAKAAAPAVRVLERKTVGDYDVSVLASTDANALSRWLERNQYHLPEAARGPMQAYIREGWTFVASRIKTPRLQTSEGLQTGTLSPLRLTFAARRPIYPMRLSAANPKDFRVLLYVATPYVFRQYGRNALEPANSATTGNMTHVFLSSDMQKSRFPTLAKLSHSGLDVFWTAQTVQPEACTKDFVWNVAAREVIRHGIIK